MNTFLGGSAKFLLFFLKTISSNHVEGRWNWFRLTLFSISFLIILFINSCRGVESRTWHFTGSTMGTFYTVTYQGNIASSKFEPVFENYLSKIENELSNWDEESWISQFNYSDETSLIFIPNHAYHVLNYGLELTEHTKGGFDPTLGKLLMLWGFGPQEGQLPPNDEAIHTALKATGAEKLTLIDSPPRVAKSHPDLQLNLSAITKGYAVDLLAEYLESKGINDYVINLGGDMRTSGQPKNEVAWTIAIQKPDPDTKGDQAYEKVLLNSAGIATSGDYRRYIEIDGFHYPHILDPDTGWPLQSNLASVTIIASTAIQADGIATACMALGVETAIELVESIEQVEGLFITRNSESEFKTIKSSKWPDLHQISLLAQ